MFLNFLRKLKNAFTGTRDGLKTSYELSVAANLDYKPASTQNLAKKFDSISNPQIPKVGVICRKQIVS